MNARIALLLAALALVAGAADLRAQPLRREIAPFRVDPGGGWQFLNPFSGGLWQPRIGLRDVTGDGRPDLFTLNPDGELRLYRNDGVFAFTRVFPSPYDTIPVSNWFRLVDLDGDGDAEILTAGPRSELMVFDNAGSDAAPAYGAMRLLRNAVGDTIYTQRETVPSLVDIDADGDLDLFAGNIDGSISYYENTGTAEVPVMTFRTSKYMDLQVIGAGVASPPKSSGELASGGRHGASVLDFVDLDGDADLDILFGDAFTFKMLHFTNAGTPTAAAFSMDRLDTAFRPTGDDVESEGFNQPVSGDLDLDGDIDVLVSSLLPSASVLPITLYENVGTATAPQMRRRSIDITSEIDLGTYAAPALIEDATRNGILVGATSGRITYFERQETSPVSFRQSASNSLPGLFQTVPAAGDLNGDGVAELVVGEAFGAIIFLRFNGSALVRYGDTFQLNRNASPTLVDLDGDGDLDIFSGAENGRFHYFENRGSRTAASFTRSVPPPPFDRLDIGYDSAPRFFDLDRDGDLDMMVGGRTGGSSGGRDTLRFFLRSGGSFTESALFPPMTVARNPVPLGLRLPEGTFLLVGDLSGGIKAFRDTTVSAGAPVGGDRAGNGAGPRIEQVSATELRVTGVDDGAEVTIVDLLGRSVLRQLAAGGRVGISALATGAYLARIEGANGSATIVVVR